MIGGFDSDGNNIPKVITSPGTGDSSLRDFGKILGDGNESDIDRVYSDREKTSVVAADVQARKNKRTLNLALKIISQELGKIDINGITDVAEDDKDLLDAIDVKIQAIKRAYDF